MKALLDYLPLMVFSVLMVTRDIWAATWGLLASALAVAVYHAVSQRGRLTRMQWVTTLFVMVFSGLTLYFHNENFILWKGPIFFAVLAIAFWLSPKVDPTGKSLTQRMLGEALALSPTQWIKLNWAWSGWQLFQGLFLLFFAVVVYPVHPQWWAYAKFPGLLILTTVFMVTQLVVLRGHLKTPAIEHDSQ